MSAQQVYENKRFSGVHMKNSQNRWLLFILLNNKKKKLHNIKNNNYNIKWLHLTVWVGDEAIGVQLCGIYNSKM